MEEEHNLNLKAELCKLGSFGNIHDEYVLWMFIIKSIKS